VTNLASPYRRPVWEALAREVALDVRLLENDHRLSRDVLANRGDDWASGQGNGYTLAELRAARIVRNEARFYLLISLPRRRPDAILLGGWESPAYWQLMLLAKLTGVRTVGFYESTAQTQRHTSGAIGWMRSRFFRSLDAVVVPGAAARDAVLALGVSPSNIHVGFNAVDGGSIWETARAAREAAVEPERGGHRFVFVGQLIERKGVDLLIDAFAAVRREGDSLTVYGRGSLEDHLRRRCRDLGLGDDVVFRGYVLNEQIAVELADKHTLILPSRQEVWGLVVNEALAAGLHVIVSDVAGVAASVDRMPGVFLCRPDTASVASSMRSSRDAWDGPIDDPEILRHGPAQLADVFLAALDPSVTARNATADGDRSLHTLIVEKNVTGHRLYYVRLLAESAARKGRRVTVALPDSARQSQDISVHLDDLDPRVEVIYVGAADLTSGAELSHRVEADLTVIPDADRLAIRIGMTRRWSGRGQLSLLVMREVAQPSTFRGAQMSKTLARRLLFLSASSLRTVRLSILKPSGWEGRSYFRTANDPVTLSASADDAASTARAWGVDDDRYWFAVLGAIAPRKNPGLVARALCAAGTRPTGLLIAGAIDPEARAEIEREAGRLERAGVRLILIDRLLSDVELDAAVRLVDCVVLAHSNEGPSGLFGKAAAAGTRIVAAGASSLKRDAARAGDAATWSELDESSLADALRQAISSGRPAARGSIDAERFVTALL
jgi:glycosyltransferase involved in cell wall biosynthesis